MESLCSIEWLAGKLAIVISDPPSMISIPSGKSSLKTRLNASPSPSFSIIMDTFVGSPSTKSLEIFTSGTIFGNLTFDLKFFTTISIASSIAGKNNSPIICDSPGFRWAPTSC